MMKVWERIVDRRIRREVEISPEQFGFIPEKSTTDAIFALRMTTEEYREGQQELHCVFIDLEKAYDRVPRDDIWQGMRSKGVSEKYVHCVQDMYREFLTVVRCAVGKMEPF